MKNQTIKLKSNTVSTKWMTLRYIFALGLIALLSITSYYIVKNILTITKSSAAIINISGQEKFITHLLAKPYRKTELIKRIHSILDDKT